jgi:uncharacterized membrane protein YhiD involved in acid resistance
MKWLNHPLVVIFITILAVSFYYSLNQSILKNSSSQTEADILEAQVKKMTEETQQLEETLVKTSLPLEKEKQIRDQLLMQKPGEYVVQLANDQRKKTPVPDPVPTTSPIDSWKQLFFWK